MKRNTKTQDFVRVMGFSVDAGKRIWGYTIENSGNALGRGFFRHTGKSAAEAKTAITAEAKVLFPGLKILFPG